jgi:signal peptidase
MAGKSTKTIWQMINWKKIKIWPIVTGIIYLIVIVFAITALMSKFSIGGIKLFTVQSGSMEPAIKVGSMVVTKSQDTYQVSDVITFKDREDAQKTTTHRIVGKEDTGIIRYTTQGDANDAADSNQVLPPQIIGKVIFKIPYFGYPVAFARTWPGVIILIIIPATIIIYDEVGNIRKEWRKRKKFKNIKKLSQTKGVKEKV